MPNPTLAELFVRARLIARTLGHKNAAGYLRNRDVPFELAYEGIFGRKPRLV